MLSVISLIFKPFLVEKSVNSDNLDGGTTISAFLDTAVGSCQKLYWNWDYRKCIDGILFSRNCRNDFLIFWLNLMFEILSEMQTYSNQKIPSQKDTSSTHWKFIHSTYRICQVLNSLQLFFIFNIYWINSVIIIADSFSNHQICYNQKQIKNFL